MKVIFSAAKAGCMKAATESAAMARNKRFITISPNERAGKG